MEFLLEEENSTFTVETLDNYTTPEIDYFKVGLETFASVVLFLVIVIGNGLVVLAVWRFHGLGASATHMFVGNLAVADLLTGINVVYVMVTLYCPGLLEKKYTCLFRYAPMILSSVHSNVSLLLISIDRYIIVACPHRHRRIMTKKRVIQLIALSWAVSFTHAILPLAGVNQWEETHTCRYSCVMTKAYVLSVNSEYFTLVTCVCTIYGRLLYLYHIKRAKCRGQSLEGIQKKVDPYGSYQLAMTLLLVVLLFVMCWTPFIIASTVMVISFDDSDWVHWITTVTVYLGICNSAVNPFVYGWKSQPFRQAFGQILLCGHYQVRTLKKDTVMAEQQGSARTEASLAAPSSNSLRHTISVDTMQTRTSFQSLDAIASEASGEVLNFEEEEEESVANVVKTSLNGKTEILANSSSEAEQQEFQHQLINDHLLPAELENLQQKKSSYVVNEEGNLQMASDDTMEGGTRIVENNVTNGTKNIKDAQNNVTEKEVTAVTEETARVFCNNGSIEINWVRVSPGENEDFDEVSEKSLKSLDIGGCKAAKAICLSSSSPEEVVINGKEEIICEFGSRLDLGKPYPHESLEGLSNRCSTKSNLFNTCQLNGVEENSNSSNNKVQASVANSTFKGTIDKDSTIDNGTKVNWALSQSTRGVESAENCMFPSVVMLN